MASLNVIAWNDVNCFINKQKKRKGQRTKRVPYETLY